MSFQYSIANKSLLKAEFKEDVQGTVHTMYSSVLSIVKPSITKSLVKARVESLRLVSKWSGLSTLVTMVSEKEFYGSIKGYSDERRELAWKYRSLEIRIVLLQTILGNKTKVSGLVRDTLEAVVVAEVSSASSPTLAQIIHKMKLSSVTYTTKDGTEHPITPWGIDELRIQLVSELCELDLLHMTLSYNTYVVEIPSEYSSLVPMEVWKSLRADSELLARKTVLLEPAPVDTQMISRSSWWYDTPTMSLDQIEFIKTMHSIKWEFVDGAEDLVAEAYRKHLDVSILPKWAKARVEEYKDQIRASRENGGHYIAGMFDSALRWYWQAEIGHNQTSESLRNLVRPVGMANVVKYDMSNNVVQMYAVSLRDRSLAKYVNLLHPDECVEDLRTQLAEGMNKHLNLDVFTKSNIKPLFMVWAYNAGRNRLLDGVYTEEKNFFTGQKVRTLKVKGLRALVGGVHSDDTIWNTWIGLLQHLVPSIVELKRVMNRITKGNPFTLTHWTLPDGASAQYASVETIAKKLHWVTSDTLMRQHTHHRKELVPNAKAAGLLPRMIHSLDAYLMRQLVLRSNRMGITVVPNHDSFMFDSEHTDTLFSLVRDLLVEIMDDHVFYNILTQYNTAKVKEGGEYLDRDILDSEAIRASYPMKPE